MITLVSSQNLEYLRSILKISIMKLQPKITNGKSLNLMECQTLNKLIKYKIIYETYNRTRWDKCH